MSKHKSISVSRDTYEKLVSMKGELQAERGEVVSIGDVIDSMISYNLLDGLRRMARDAMI